MSWCNSSWCNQNLSQIESPKMITQINNTRTMIMISSRHFTFLVLFCIISFIALRHLESFYDAGTYSLRSMASKRRNLGLLTQYNDPKAVVNKSRENVQPLTSDEITPPATDFIFLVAIEGSGHHMNEALFAKSPANDRLVKLKVRPHVNDMLTSLYNNQDKSHGLFSAPTARGRSRRYQRR